MRQLSGQSGIALLISLITGIIIIVVIGGGMVDYIQETNTTETGLSVIDSGVGILAKSAGWLLPIFLLTPLIMGLVIFIWRNFSFPSWSSRSSEDKRDIMKVTEEDEYECKFCGGLYTLDESDAEEVKEFCSEECQEKYYENEEEILKEELEKKDRKKRIEALKKKLGREPKKEKELTQEEVDRIKGLTEKVLGKFETLDKEITEQQKKKVNRDKDPKIFGSELEDKE